MLFNWGETATADELTSFELDQVGQKNSSLKPSGQLQPVGAKPTDFTMTLKTQDLSGVDRHEYRPQ